MKKRMEKVEVQTTDDGNILITQESEVADPAIVCIAPDQVDVLTGWLNEAREEITRRGGARLHSIDSKK